MAAAKFEIRKIGALRGKYPFRPVLCLSQDRSESYPCYAALIAEEGY
jgi:hypothetical protein